MSKTGTISNVVGKETLREVQSDVLNEVADYLTKSFGPYGSTTIIRESQQSAAAYTKDGHDILRRIKYNGAIESTIVDNLVDITRHVVNTVGDGTTSAVEMARSLFNIIRGEFEQHDNIPAKVIVDTLNDVVTDICEEIKNQGRACTAKDIYDICLTSTNGNERLAKEISYLYTEYGMNVSIDLQVALASTEDIVKTYEGMSISCGYTDAIYANVNAHTCDLINPNIYFFEDPIDTPEMIALFDSIVAHNIYEPYRTDKINDVVPTLIIAPKISGDMSSYLSNLTDFMMNFKNAAAKPPFCLVSSYYNIDEMSDIAKMCGARTIRKYINDEIHMSDIEKGLAPTPDTVCGFCGTCGKVSISSNTSQFIDPAAMYNADHSGFSDTYINLRDWLQAELDKAIEENANASVRYKLRKRLNSLSTTVVEYFVGGISISDRDNNKALLEDAIKNCASAVTYGVGWGANVEGFIAAVKLLDRIAPNSTYQRIHKVVIRAYEDVIRTLYKSAGWKEDAIMQSIHNNFNAAYGEFEGVNPLLIKDGPDDINMPAKAPMRTGLVKTSIMTDVEVLTAVSKIISLMVTSNQFILPSPQHNVYVD